MSTSPELNHALLALGMRIRPFFLELSRVAGFEVPMSTRQKFLTVHAALTATPRLPMLERLTVEGGSRKDWLKPLTIAILDNVQEGLAASYYHLANVEAIEHAIEAVTIAALPDLQMPAGSAVGGGNTRRLNFEYQAFVFALRRTLEYFAVSVGAFFKRDVHRIRSLTQSIAAAEPEEMSGRVRAKLKEALESLSDILPPSGETRSVRDQLAHWKAVDAGTFNIMNGPDVLQLAVAGGGENLRPWDLKTGPELMNRREGDVVFTTLSPTLRAQISRVEGLIFGVYSDVGLSG